MKKGTYFTYRFLGTFVALMAYMGFFSFIVRLFGGPLRSRLMLYIFVSGCMVIYSILSRLFSQVVLKEGKPLRKSLMEWIIANATVVIAGLAYAIYVTQAKLTSPAFARPILENFNKSLAEKHLSNAYPPEFGHTMLVVSVMFVCTIIGIGIIHAVWTLFLVKRYKDYFQ
jgi:hypothetical protein